MNQVITQETIQSESQETSQARTITRWIRNGVIKPNTSAESAYILERFPVVIDTAILTAEPEPKSVTLDGEHTPSQTDIEKLEREKVFREVVFDLVQNDIIGKELAKLVGNNLKPHHMQSYGGRNGLFKTIYDSPNTYTFRTIVASRKPLGFDKPDELILSRQPQYEQRLASYLSEVGISMDESIIREIILKSVLAHEYGHAVLAALIRQNARATLKQNDFISPEQAANHSRSEIYDRIYQGYPIDTDVRDRLETYPANIAFSPGSTSDERVARGFEFEMMRIQLKKNNIAIDVIDQIISKFRADFYSSYREEFIELFDTAERAGMPLPDILLCLGRLREKEDLNPSAREAVNYSIAHIGYAYGLTGNQLKEWLSSLSWMYTKEDTSNTGTSSEVGVRSIIAT